MNAETRRGAALGPEKQIGLPLPALSRRSTHRTGIPCRDWQTLLLYYCAACSLPPWAWRCARCASLIRISIRSASGGLLSQNSGRRDAVAAAGRSPDTQSIAASHTSTFVRLTMWSAGIGTGRPIRRQGRGLLDAATMLRSTQWPFSPHARTRAMASASGGSECDTSSTASRVDTTARDRAILPSSSIGWWPGQA